VPLLFSPNHTRVGAAPDFRRPANPVRERTIKLDEGPAETGSLEPVMNFPTSGAGSQFFSDRGARSDEYGVSSSDKGRRNEENWPQPSGFHPNAQSSRAGDPGLRRKSAILRCHPRLWSRHSLRIPPRLHPTDEDLSVGAPVLARFSFATPPARKFITGSRGDRPCIPRALDGPEFIPRPAAYQISRSCDRCF